MKHISCLPWLLTVLLGVLPFILTAQPPTYYLEIPDIQGEATQLGYEDQICVTSFSWNLGMSVSDTGSTTGDGRPTPEPFRIGKNFDVASPYLFSAAARHKGFPEMTLTILAPDPSGALVEVAEYVFKNVHIVAYETGGDATGVLPEVISIYMESLEIHHSDSGTEMEYDFTTGI